MYGNLRQNSEFGALTTSDIMSIDLASLKELFDFLQARLIKNDTKAREKVYGLHDSLTLSISRKLASEVAEAQQAVLGMSGNLPTRYKGVNLQNEKAELLENINLAIKAICTYEALVLCVMSAFRQGLNGCQEHATLVSLALLSLYGVNMGPHVENTMLEIHGTPYNHEFVVFERAAGSTLNDVSSWGNCLVIDSYGHWFAGINNLPAATAIANFLQDKIHSRLTISVFHDNKMKLHLLHRYQSDPEHPFHTIEKVSLKVLTDHVTSFVENAMAKLGLPRLKVLPSPTLCVDSLFAPTNSLAGGPTIVRRDEAESNLTI